MLQRCGVAGCTCGGTCGGHGTGPRAERKRAKSTPGGVAARRGELPLDATLARAVLARSAARGEGDLARSSAPAGAGDLARPSAPAGAGVLARSSSSGSSGSGGGGGGGGGGAPVAGAACKVDVRATHIGGILSGLPIWHLFVVTTDGAGTERYYRGGPGGSGGAPAPYGTIITNDGLYVAGTVDWSPGAPSTTVQSGAAACGHDACLAAELRRIDGTATPYAPTGPNSNTTASTILANCNIPRGKPVWIAPGWDDPAI